MNLYLIIKYEAFSWFGPFGPYSFVRRECLPFIHRSFRLSNVGLEKIPAIRLSDLYVVRFVRSFLHKSSSFVSLGLAKQFLTSTIRSRP
jgi:hypothetical protein